MNVEAIAAVTEGKITRAELVELAIDSMRKKLAAEYAEITEEMKKAKAVGLTLKEAFALLKEAGPSIKLERRTEGRYNALRQYETVQTGWQLTLSATLPMSTELPKRVAAAIARYDELKPLRLANNLQSSKLNGGAKQARVELIKQALEQSPAGQKVLAAIETLRADVHSKLLGTGAAK